MEGDSNDDAAPLVATTPLHICLSSKVTLYLNIKSQKDDAAPY